MTQTKFCGLSNNGVIVSSVSAAVVLQESSLDFLDSSSIKKTQRCKRPARPDKDRAPLKNKRRKREEEEEKSLHSSSSSSDPLMTHLTQVELPPVSSPSHLV